MKIVIIGAGWYGCHLASVLKRDHEVILLEKEDEIFTNAAMNNQQRLHLGYHYSFSETTRNQCVRGYKDFLEQYSFLCYSLEHNFYQVHESGNIHHDDYCKIMKNQGLPVITKDVKEYNPFHSYSNNPFIVTDELVIGCEKAKLYFEDELKDIIEYSTKVIDINEEHKVVRARIDDRTVDYKYDLVINCSYYNVNFLNPHPKVEIPMKYEASFIPVLKIPKEQVGMDNGLIMMDGDFISLLPIYKSNYDYQKFSYFTLSSVTHTHLNSSDNYEEALKSMRVSKADYYKDQWLKLILDKTRQYIDIDKFDFTIEEVLHSIKVKPKNDSSFSRDFLCRMEGSCINIYGGKIDTIIQAERAVKTLMKSIKR